MENKSHALAAGAASVVPCESIERAREVAAALDVWNHDEEIDQLYNSLFRELLTYMMEDPRNIGFCTHLLFCAKNIERIGDHATNIAETIHYLVTGTAISTDRPRVSGHYAPLDPVGKQ